MSSSSDPSRVRASDADRHRVAEQLRAATGEGRLDFDELDQRLDLAYRAKTYADLAPLIADLPWSGGAVPGAGAGGADVVPGAGGGVPVPLMHYDKTRSVFSGERRRGVWEIGARHQITSVVAGVELDLRQVRFTARETEIACFALMGTINVLVNPVTHVILDGFKAAGEFAQQRDEVPAELGPDSPVVRVTGYAVLGTVEVVRKQVPPPPRKRFWGRRREQ